MATRQAASVLEKALEYLGRREYYRQELKQKLKNKGYPLAEIDETLEQLQRSGKLSEQRYLEAYVFDRQRRLYGPQWIRTRLVYKGFDRATIDLALCDDLIDWYENMRRCCNKKFGSDNTTDAKEKVRRRNYLYRRGFLPDMINQLFGEYDDIQ